MPELAAEEVKDLEEVERLLCDKGVEELKVVGNHAELRYDKNGLSLTLTPSRGSIVYFNMDNWNQEQEELYSWVTDNYNHPDEEGLNT